MTKTVFAREVVAGGLTALPPVNSRLTVVAPPRPDGSAADADGRGRATEVPSRVEDLRLEVTGRRPGPAEVVIAQPAFAGNLEGERPGTVYVLRWVTERGVHEVTGRFVARERIGPALIGWRLQVDGPVSRVQRRAHARVDVSVAIEMAVPDDATRVGRPAGVTLLRGTTVNLSEGGVLALLDWVPSSPREGAAVVVRFAVSGQPFVLTGHVVRVQEASRPGRAGGIALAVAFDTPDVHGDKLRPLLFARQLNARRVGVL
jgi:hypothetical protein